MKIIVLALIVLSSSISFAQKDLSSYKVLDVLYSNKIEWYAKGSFAGLCTSYLSQLRASAHNIASDECSDIILKTTIAKETHRELFHTTAISGQVIIEVLCKPRPFSEIALISQLNHCKQAPGEECHKIAAQLDKAKPTRYVEKISGSCSSL